jgi:perosamine synthetase
VLPGREHVWHQYTVLVDPDAPVTREQLMQHLGREGIGCGVYYPKVAYDYEVYRSHPGVRLDEVPVAASVAQRCLSLPVHPFLESGDIERIAGAVAEAGGS